jgi:hypothetical protein
LSSVDGNLRSIKQSSRFVFSRVKQNVGSKSAKDYGAANSYDISPTSIEEEGEYLGSRAAEYSTRGSNNSNLMQLDFGLIVGFR